MSAIDLHVHSTASDGTFTPAEVVREAGRFGLQAIGLTDHDTVSGLPEAMISGREHGIEIIPGCELSVSSVHGPMHILGLFIPPDGGRLALVLEDLRNKRHMRNELIVEKMQSLGLDITYEQIKRIADGGTVGRPHIARTLIDLGYVSSFEEAFEKYIGPQGTTYVPKEKLTPEGAISILKDVQATVVLAHPFSLELEEKELSGLIKDLKGKGLDGLEAYYSEHDPTQTTTCLDLARRFDLLVSGGSDFHGSVKPEIFLGRGKGGLSIPVHLLHAMKEHRQDRGLPITFSMNAPSYES